MAITARKIDPEAAVRARYGKAAQVKESALCCPVSYDPRYLDAIPKEIRDKDYGCGDPSLYVREGDTVLDLGSGGGKICYIAAQIVGRKGRVIGVDMNPEMLALARKYRREMAVKLGYDAVAFHRARIQDLGLSLDALDQWLARNPVKSADDVARLEEMQAHLRATAPLVPDESVDVILSNCVLNLVGESAREQLFREMFRVLRRGGRVAISDIVSDEVVPEELKRDPELWSGCIAGAFQESAFLEAFERAGFHAIALEKRDERPWRTVKGIEFRSATLTARKGKQGPCWERNQAVIYKGPWKKVEDDDGHVLLRGERIAVCDKTFHILTGEPYGDQVIPVPPIKDIPLARAKAFDCSRTSVRAPAETKGKRYRKTETSAAACAPGGACC